MNIEVGILLTSKLLSLALILNGIEFFVLSQNPKFIEIWSFKNLKKELQNEFLFSLKSFQITALMLILLGLSLLFLFNFWIIVSLFFLHLFICIRFRGAFNGGSDMMLFVVLIGLLITSSTENPFTQKLGLIFIAINCLYSYFKAGLSKINTTDWISGIALPRFLERSLYTDVLPLSNWLSQHSQISRILCTSVIAFELSFVLLLFFPRFVIFYFFAAVIFHFLVYFAFGLNRFFWAWLSAWPAVFFGLGLL